MPLTADEKQKARRAARIAGRDRIKVRSRRIDDSTVVYGLESRRHQGPVLIDVDSEEALEIDDLLEFLTRRHENRTA